MKALGNVHCSRCGQIHPSGWDCAEAERQDKARWKRAFDALTHPAPPAPTVEVYRDIFAEITAKAKPHEFDVNDPERIVSYVIPCGPLHRAAGKLGFQMFNGEAYLAAAVSQIETLTRELDAAREALNTAVERAAKS